MLVDLARNDLARIAVPGSRYVDNMLHIDKYQSVMHLVSDVHATLRDDLDALHAYLACMNMGTLSGAPKIKAHELIYKYEGKSVAHTVVSWEFFQMTAHLTPVLPFAQLSLRVTKPMFRQAAV